METTKERKIAGFWRQAQIILWKNLLLYSKNIVGIIFELATSFLFLVVLMIIITQDSKSYNGGSQEKKDYVKNINSYQFEEGCIYYYPETSLTRSLMEKVYKQLIKDNYPVTDLIGTNVSSPLKLNETESDKISAFYSFSDNDLSLNDTFSDTIEYTIYKRNQYRLFGSSKYFEFNKGDIYVSSVASFCRTYLSYDNQPYNYLKYVMDKNLIEMITNTEAIGLNYLTTESYFCPGYEIMITKSFLSFLTSTLICLSFLSPFIINMSQLIVEKQTKMKEYLKLIGVEPMVIWFCSIFRILIVYMLISIVYIIFLKLPLNSTDESEYLSTDGFLLFVLLFVYSFQTVMLSLLFGQIFKKSLSAKIITIFLWLFTAFGGQVYGSIPPGLIYFLSIFPNIGLGFAFQLIFQFERENMKLDLTTMFTNVYGSQLRNQEISDANPIFGFVMLSMIGWTLVYFVLSWYIERISPGEYGIKLPYFFPFMKSYWMPQKVKFYEDKCEQLLDDDNEAFEKVHKSLKASVRIRDLTKTFQTGFEKITVVNKVNLNFYENQITGFLGHNGAGKTTVTFMLCGLYSPNAGTAYILDQDIRTQIDHIRSSLGFCPQHSILFDELSVRQHLDLIASIKGFSKHEIAEEINRISICVGLNNDLNKLAKQLSGGMKRRLSIAMALIGDSKVIILDEPTSGLDPFNRRALWELLRNYKKNRTIILTTHYMEEADALSDRIALMDHGKVKCCGSPIFLKNKYGSGYRITLTKESNFDMQALSTMFNDIIHQSPKVLSNMAKEICLGIATGNNANLPELLNEIEANKQRIGVSSYGISSPTVEEVFLKMGSIDVNEDQTVEQSLSNVFDKNQINAFLPNLYGQQLLSLILKRFHILKRRYILLLTTLVVPIGFNVLCSFFSTSLGDIISQALSNTSPKISLDIVQTGYQDYPYKLNTNVSESVGRFFEDYMKKKTDSVVLPIRMNQNQSVIGYVNSSVNENVMNLARNFFYGAEFSSISNSSELAVNVLWSGMGSFSQRSSINEISSFYFAYAAKNMNKTILTYNQEWTNKNPDDIVTFDQFQCIEGIPFSFIDLFNGYVIALLIGLSTIHATRERSNGSKRLQLLQGTHFVTYWVSNYIFDFLINLVSIGSIIITLVVIAQVNGDSEAYVLLGTIQENAFYLSAFMVISSLSWSTFAYLWSFLFKSDIVAFVILYLVMAGVATIDMAMSYLYFIYNQERDDNAWMNPFQEFFRTTFALFFPNIPVKRAIFNLKVQHIELCVRLFTDGKKSKVDVFDWHTPGLGSLLTYNFIFLIFGITLLVCIEMFGATLKHLLVQLVAQISNQLSRKSVNSNNTENSETFEADVDAEVNRIYGGSLFNLKEAEPIVVKNLYKKYRVKGKEVVAVNNLTFGIQPGECFGLLGLNGAGKTTTLKILTDEEKATFGFPFVNGVNVSENLLQKDLSLGFCPQFEYLPDYMTVQEVLYLFANLRGIQPDRIKPVVNEFIDIFKLTEFRHRLAQNLSGGNKRKLSSAVAFIGNPKTIILDEPTSGMDPAARRYLWNVIKKARDNGSTIILTTHSMEESEALCSKLAIMVNGQFACLGNIQHLKSKYGKGYSLVIKLKSSEIQDKEELSRNVTQVQNFVTANIPCAVLKDFHEDTLFYQMDGMDRMDSKLQGSAMSIGNIFSIFEANKDALGLETYSLSQTTLEQVFMSFARKQANQQTAQAGAGVPVPVVYNNGSVQISSHNNPDVRTY